MAKEIKKSKKVSINTMDKIVKENKVENATFEWNGATVEVKRTLSFTDLLKLVQVICASCFTNDTGEYLPEARELATRAGVMDAYTNVRLPDNIDHKYEILFGTDIYEKVVQYIDRMQFGTLLNCIDEKLDYLAEANIIMVRKQMSDAMQKFEQMIDQTTELFSGVNAEDLKKVSKAIAEHGVPDEKKIMEAYLETKKETEQDGE